MESLTIYKSSAGSGKTFTLVLEYLKIVILHPSLYRNVLAITFTNKATEEMKNRIILALESLSLFSESELTQKKDPIYLAIREHLDDLGKQNIAIPSQARKVLANILNGYSNFSVSTIESFFQRVVRAFTRELNIPLGFDVEMQQDLVLERLVHKMFMEVGTKPTLTRLFKGMLQRKLSDDKGWNIEPEVKRLGEQIFKEKYQKLTVEQATEGNLVDTILDFTQDLFKIKKAFENKMEAWAREAQELMEAYGLELEDFKYKKSGVPGYFKAVLERGEYEPKTRTRQGYESLEAWAKKDATKYSEIEAALQAGLWNILKEMVDFFDQQGKAYYSAEHMNRTIYSFGVLDDLRQMLTTYRQENQQMIISDTNFLLKTITYDPGQPLGANAPFIYEKVGTRYHFYLLDEFQDTSDMQWENLRPLVIEAMSQQFEGIDTPLKVGLMGDVKQSIYRWRNGNMRLLLQDVEEQVYAETRQSAQIKPLEKNWRTGAEIVRFNNQFFKAAAELMANCFPGQEEVFLGAYNEVSQFPQGPSAPSFAAIHFVPDKERNTPMDAPGWREQSLELTVHRIQSLLEEGFRGRDITLLVRRNTEGTLVAEYLQKHSIKVISAESLLLVSHPAVRFMLAVLRFLVEDKDPIAKASLSYYYALLHVEEGENANRVEEALTFIPSEFTAQIPRLKQLALFECIMHLRSIFPVLNKPNAYVQGFIDVILEYSEKYDASISGFLPWWQEVEHKRAVASAEDNDAVRIMTIHKAKGLEFPIVILPFCDWTNKPFSRDIIWVKSPGITPYDTFPYLPLHPFSTLKKTYFFEAYEEERLLSYLDNLNLLYVAFTRPKFRLYVFTKKYVAKRQQKYPEGPEIADIHQLVSFLVERPDVEGEMKQEPERFEAGDPGEFEDIQPFLVEEKSLAKDIALTEVEQVSDDWTGRIRVRYSSNRYLKSDVVSSQEKIAAGELLHEALSYIKDESDVPQAALTMKLKGYIHDRQIDNFQSQLKKIVSHPEVSHWYSKGKWEIKNEADILDENGILLRPDRVMLQGEKALVVDYKSGQESSAYKKQVREYMQALRKLGSLEVRGFIYYLLSGKIEEVLG